MPNSDLRFNCGEYFPGAEPPGRLVNTTIPPVYIPRPRINVRPRGGDRGPPPPQESWKCIENVAYCPEDETLPIWERSTAPLIIQSIIRRCVPCPTDVITYGNGTAISLPPFMAWREVHDPSKPSCPFSTLDECLTNFEPLGWHGNRGLDPDHPDMNSPMCHDYQFSCPPPDRKGPRTTTPRPGGPRPGGPGTGTGGPGTGGGVPAYFKCHEQIFYCPQDQLNPRLTPGEWRIQSIIRFPIQCLPGQGMGPPDYCNYLSASDAANGITRPGVPPITGPRFLCVSELNRLICEPTITPGPSRYKCATRFDYCLNDVFIPPRLQRITRTPERCATADPWPSECMYATIDGAIHGVPAAGIIGHVPECVTQEINSCGAITVRETPAPPTAIPFANPGNGPGTGGGGAVGGNPGTERRFRCMVSTDYCSNLPNIVRARRRTCIECLREPDFTWAAECSYRSLSDCRGGEGGSGPGFACQDDPPITPDPCFVNPPRYVRKGQLPETDR